MKNITVLLAEDHTIVRQGLRALLDQTDDIKVIAEVEDGREAVKRTKQIKPDVVLMDISMPLLNGVEATRQIKKQNPDVRVLILTMHSTEEYIFQILRAGASGFLLKKSAHEELEAAIKEVHGGNTFLSPMVSKVVIDEYLRKAKEGSELDPFEMLTQREREVLQLIAEGNSNTKIADILYISVKTVETHKAHLMDKLDIHTRADLVKYAIEKGII